MSVTNIKVIDGIGINKEENGIKLLLCDHLPWEGENAPKVVDHLLLLQKKINVYVAFLKSGQYKATYPELEVKIAVIDIRFRYEIPETCEEFLQSLQEQISEFGIMIETYVG